MGQVLKGYQKLREKEYRWREDQRAPVACDADGGERAESYGWAVVVWESR